MKPDLFQAPDYYLLDDLLTEEHKLVRDSARAWVKREVSPIIEDYAQRASAYVYFYSFVKQVRKWYKIGKEPYNNKKIVHKMPKNLNGRYTVFPKKLFNLYKECV